MHKSNEQLKGMSIEYKGFDLIFMLILNLNFIKYGKEFKKLNLNINLYVDGEGICISLISN
jgi:hypothetical protein